MGTFDFPVLFAFDESFVRFFDSRFIDFSLDFAGGFADDKDEEEGGNDEEMAGFLDLDCFPFDGLEESRVEATALAEGVSKKLAS